MSKKTSPLNIADYIQSTRLQVYFHHVPLGVPVVAGVGTCVQVLLCEISLCTFVLLVRDILEVFGCVQTFVCVQACEPLCSAYPQQTGTQILALWAAWLKLFMLCHCDLSLHSPITSVQKPPPCHAMLCVVASLCMSLLHLAATVNLSLHNSAHTQRRQ